MVYAKRMSYYKKALINGLNMVFLFISARFLSQTLKQKVKKEVNYIKGP